MKELILRYIEDNNHKKTFHHISELFGIPLAELVELVKNYYDRDIRLRVSYIEEYNLVGKEIYYEDSDGDWIKREYNSNGNQIYFETIEGYWLKREYNSKGNEIYFENSYGYWAKYKYDSNGVMTYHENKSGVIMDIR